MKVLKNIGTYIIGVILISGIACLLIGLPGMILGLFLPLLWWNDESHKWPNN